MKIAPFVDLRERLKTDRTELATAFLEKPAATRYLARHAALADDVLSELCKRVALPADYCLAAVGGYGRGELFPGSDVDVLLLLPHDPDPGQQATLETWVQACWDIGLEIGHSVRTIEACLAEAEADITVETNLLEARHVWGSISLFDEFSHRFRERFDARHFFDGKFAEQQARHARFDDSAYRLEPNLKDSPGGLRDLHTIHWLAQACGIHGGWSGIARAGLLTQAEARRIAHEERTLSMLRIHLHLLARRREDRLAFDYQTELADRLGLAATAHKLPGERLMQGYYRAAKLIQRINDILVQSLRVRLSPVMAPPEPIDADFQLRANLLEARDPELFMRAPDALLRAFIVYAQHPALAGFEPATLRALWRGSTRIDAGFRANPAHRALFMALLRQPVGVTRALRAMHRYGLLGRYIPAFGRIVGQMQHDLFHVYTVDQHILMVVRNLRRFFMPEHAHEYPLCSQLATGWDKPWILTIAALFHDIGKGRGGNHSQIGAREAAHFCRQYAAHGITGDDARLIEFLVAEHLLMSQVAQKQDLSDPAVIAAFAERVCSERTLTALYLLTVADIRGTSPKVWTAWKGKLLEDLYHASLAALGGRTPDPATEIEERKRDARVVLALHALPTNAHEKLWQTLDVSYFLRHDAADIAWHTRQLREVVDSRQPVVRARKSLAGEGLQVLVYTPDQSELFLRICGYFDRADFSILAARIHTTRSGHALDTFQVMPRHAVSGVRELITLVENELPHAIDLRTALPQPRPMRLSRRARSFPVATRVTLRPDEHGERWILTLTAADRAGLLYVVAGVLAAHALSVQLAKVSTLGERVEDTFVIAGEELQRGELQLRIESDLLNALSH